MTKRKKAVICVISVLFIFGVVTGIYALCVNSYIKNREKDKIFTVDSVSGGYDCIIILGCGIKDDGRPSDMLYDRIITGVELYKKGIAPRILMSGDHGRTDYDEVGTMKKYAVDMGVPEDAVFCDHAGFSTYESMVRANKVFGIENAVVVTQSYHLYRALYDAESFGIDAYGVSADVRRYLGQTNRNIREIIARNKDFLFCVFKPDPKYLGEKIDITGSGSVTNG